MRCGGIPTASGRGERQPERLDSAVVSTPPNGTALPLSPADFGKLIAD
jgi:hypothetical protein